MSTDMSDNIVFLDRDTTDRDDLDLSGLESLGQLVYHGITAPGEEAHDGGCPVIECGAVSV